MTQIFDVLSLQYDRHSLKFGVDFRRERLGVIQPSQPTGLFSFTAQGTNQPANNSGGNAFASFLLGQVQTFSIDLQQSEIHPRASILEYFGQDTWRLTDRLTLSLGLRHTLNFPSTEVHNQGGLFDLEEEQLDYLGEAGYPETARTLHKLNLGPRLGVAYRLGDHMVLRGGYGVIWQEQAGITTPFTIPNFPFIQTVTQRSLDGVNPAFILSAGPTVQPVAFTPDAGLGQGVFSVDRNLGSGYVQQWNLAWQRELGPNVMIELAYAGSKITHVGIPDTNINQLTQEQLALGPTLLDRVPNP